MFLGLNDVAFLAAAAGGAALDPDAAAYIAAVEAADTQALEPAVRAAINDFVVGCKADGIWNAIKASCILSGARTLTGALVPLVGAAPTNFNFVAGDYNRKTGLVGNANTKYLDSNRNSDADPQDSQHLAIYTSTNVFQGTDARGWIGTVKTPLNLLDQEASSSTALRAFSRNNSPVQGGSLSGVGGFAGLSRSSSTVVTVRGAGASVAGTTTSSPPNNDSLFVFARNNNGTPQQFSSVRLVFYSIGESLDLALLDARVTALINTFAWVIP